MTSHVHLTTIQCVHIPIHTPKRHVIHCVHTHTQGVRDTMAAALSTELPSAAASPAAFGRGPLGAFDITPWQPQGVLVAQLAEHTMAVNQLAVAGNGAFFASASDDGTVKVWDCRRLERDVAFRSRLTYAGQGGRITAVAACQEGQSMVSASSNGSLHVWRVEYTCRWVETVFGGVQLY